MYCTTFSLYYSRESKVLYDTKPLFSFRAQTEGSLLAAFELRETAIVD
jgi:hypothetical protein